MGITDLFRASWKHKDAAVRARAVRGMDTDDTPLLLQIAETDSDRGVRELAVNRIEDADVLAELAQRCSDAWLTDLANERANGLRIGSAIQGDDPVRAAHALARITADAALADIVKRAQLEAIRLAALERLQDVKALAEVVRTAADRDLCLTVLGRIEDPSVLRGIALADPRREVANAALDRLDDPDALQAIAQQAKVKFVRNRAKKLLKVVQPPDTGAREQALAQKKLHAQLVQLCRTVEKISASTHWEETGRHIEQAQEQWAALTRDRDEEDPKLEQRFKAACLGFNTRRDQALAHHAARSAVPEARRADPEPRRADPEEHRAEREARSALCEEILALDGENAEERLAELTEKWEALGPAPEPIREELDRRFDSAVQQCRQRHERAASAEETRAAFEALLRDAEEAIGLKKVSQAAQRFGRIQQEWGRLERAGGRDAELAEGLAGLQQRLRQREEEEQAADERHRAGNQAKLEGLIRRVTEAAAGQDLRTAERLGRDAKSALQKPGPLPNREIWRELRKQLESAQKQLHDRLLELREADDWQRWSNLPRLEELCGRMESLAVEEDLATVAKVLRACQAEWKKIGPAPREKADAQWTRFKTACDAAYARCEEYFAEQSTQRDENLKLKEALCEQVEALVDSPDFTETTERIKQLQADWKAIGPVPRNKSDALWKRFRATCDRFFDRRKEHFKAQDEQRRENLTQKEALCEQVEALMGADEWVATADKIKQLQAAWKAIGPVPRNKSDALWTRFRSACDHFFERRKSHLDEGRGANLARTKELCAALELLVSGEGESTAPADLAKQVLDAWTEWKTIGPIPFDMEEPMLKRLEDVTAKAVAAHPAEFAGSPLDVEANARRLAELCMQAEVLAGNAAEKRDGERLKLEEQDAETMAARLKEALAKNTFAQESRAEDEQRFTDGVAALRKSWSRSGPVPGEQGRALRERFEKACAEALGRRPAA
ncbi:MAG: DUF349 domain-containing protein [bacterium]